jgi:serine/threonine protein kinase
VNTIAPGMKLGHYLLGPQIGIGGLGRVYKAQDQRNGDIVALKILHEKYANDRKFLGIFHKELMIMGSLSHKHIVGYRESYFNPPNCYVITDYIDGWSGYSFLKKGGQLPPLVAFSIILDLLQAIDHLHLHDTIHADLSAANYMIDRHGRVYLMDFGLSCRTEVENYKNYMVGTPGYHSPEHISDQAISPKTDIYCVGILLYELLTGQKPVPSGQDRRKTLKLMRKINFSEVTTTDWMMQLKIRKFLKKCLSWRQSGRFANIEETMLSCYDILRRYHIRYARHAIRQYIVTMGLDEGLPSGPNQNIFYGWKRNSRVLLQAGAAARNAVNESSKNSSQSK